MDSIEKITNKEQVLCILVRASLVTTETTFITPPEYKQQVGFVVYPKDGEIVRHTHLPLERHLVGTSEVILVKKGRCLLDIYDDSHVLVATR